MELDSKCEGGGKHRHKVRIDVVAYNRKRRMMPDDRRSDKGLPTRSERVSPGPLSRKPFGFLFSSLGRDGHEASSRHHSFPFFAQSTLDHYPITALVLLAQRAAKFLAPCRKQHLRRGNKWMTTKKGYVCMISHTLKSSSNSAM